MNKFMLIAVTMLACLLAAGAAVQAAVITVYPADMHGWFVNKTAGTVEMVSGPGSPPLGAGSAHLNPGAYGSDYAGLATNNYAGTRLADLTSLIFSTYCTQNDGKQFPFMVIALDAGGGATVDKYLYFEPAYQSPGQPATQMNTWQTWNALAGGWTDSPNTGTNIRSLANYLASRPNAQLANPGAVYGAVNLLVGGVGDNYQFNGYVDNVTIGTASGGTTYNFEVTPEPATMALLAAGGVASLARRRRK